MVLASWLLAQVGYTLPACHYILICDFMHAQILGNHYSLVLIQLILNVILITPVCFVMALGTKRWTVKNQCLNKNTLMSSLIYVVVGDILLEVWIPSPSCLTQPSNADTIHLPIVAIIRLLGVYFGTYLGHLFVPIALTGSIATGKSTVAKMLQQIYAKEGSSSHNCNSFVLIDTDKIGHEILIPPSVVAQDRLNHSIYPGDSVYSEILKAFGNKEVNYKNILDDNERIDRKKLGAIIFQDATQRRKLNRITHPRIIYVMLKLLMINIYMRRCSRLVCADVPLLFESGRLRWLFAVVIVVVCTPELQLERLRLRNPDLDEQQCRNRISSQIPVEQKAILSDTVIWNNGSVEDLRKQADCVRKVTETKIRGPCLSISRYILAAGSIYMARAVYTLVDWE